MICLWKEKIVSLLCDLSSKRKNVFVAVWFVLNSAKFYFTTYFTVGTTYYWDEVGAACWTDILNLNITDGGGLRATLASVFIKNAEVNALQHGKLGSY